MPRFDFECEECGTFEVSLPTGTYEIGACPTCQGPVRKLIPTGVGFECARLASEQAPRYAKWLETEGARRMALPDNHPDKLEPVARGSDLAHGIHDVPRPKVDAEKVVLDGFREYAEKSKADQKITVHNSSA